MDNRLSIEEHQQKRCVTEEVISVNKNGNRTRRLSIIQSNVELDKLVVVAEEITNYNVESRRRKVSIVELDKGFINQSFGNGKLESFGNGKVESFGIGAVDSSDSGKVEPSGSGAKIITADGGTIVDRLRRKISVESNCSSEDGFAHHMEID